MVTRVLPAKPLFISPKNGQKITVGKNFLIDLRFPNQNEVARVEIGMGKRENPFNLSVMVTPPFKYMQKFPDRVNVAYYLATENTTYLVALITYKNGKKEEVVTKLMVNNETGAVWFDKPEKGQTFNKNNGVIPISITVNAPGETVAKVEVIVGSGYIFTTFTQPPYTTSIDVNRFCQGVTAKVPLPLGVKAYTDKGEYYDSRDIYCEP